MKPEEDGIPLVDVDSNPKQKFCRTTSCFGEPSENALNFVLNNDLEKLSSLLADIYPSTDDDLKKSDFLPLNHWINSPFNVEKTPKTLLQLAIEKEPAERAEKFVRVLLSAGARPDVYNEILGVCPIHVAASKGLTSVIQILLNFCSSLSSRVLNSSNYNGSTALHIAVENDDSQLFKYLLSRDEIDVDAEDCNGHRTPLYLAVKKKNRDFIKLLIENGASVRNSSFGKTIEELLNDTLPDFDWRSIKVLKQIKSSKEIASALEKILDEVKIGKVNADAKLITFQALIWGMRKELNTFAKSGMTLLQKACFYGLHKFVQSLLDAGADPNSVCDKCSSSPLLLAAYHAHAQVIQVLIDHKQNSTDGVAKTKFSTAEKDGGETVLHWVLKRPMGEDLYSQYDDCFHALMSGDHVIMDELKMIVNRKDRCRNTPLHYATQLWSQDVVRQILELGANIAIRNIRDEIPISKISPETMENFLNNFCIKSQKPVTDKDFEITFNYSFLAPPVDSPDFDESDPEGQELVKKAALPETESLWYMSMSKPHRHLLKHPVISSFVDLKWGRICGYFNRNLRFYVMFVICSTWYIFERYGGLSLKSLSTAESTFCQELSTSSYSFGGFWYVLFAIHCFLQLMFMVSDWKRDFISGHLKAFSRSACIVNTFFASWLETLTLVMMAFVLVYSLAALWYVITVLIGFLVAREAFQMSVSLKRYAFTPENWLEILVISLMGVILWTPDEQFTDPCAVKRHLAAIIIVASWAELVTFVARHPRLSRYNIYVTMFYKVLKTFFFFLVWYSFFIVAFALGFYIMLHRDTGEPETPDDYRFFNDPFLSMVKTTTMFVGEIEFSGIPVEGPLQPLSYTFLLLFVFLIIVVLMNLLNGLAVSDTGIIKEKAEAVAHSSRVDTISYIESLLLGDPFDFLSNWPPLRWVRSLPSLSLCRCLCQRNEALKSLTNKLTGATGILIFYSILSKKTLTVFPNRTSRVVCCLGEGSSDVHLPREVLDSAKSVVIETHEMERRRLHNDQVDDRIEGILSKIENLEKNFTKIMQALNINQ